MKQRNRFASYFIGILIGILCVYFIFGGGSDNKPWLPNDMVLYRLQESLVIDAQASCLMECHHFTEEDLKKLLESGDVAFDESQTKGDDKTYILRSANSRNEMIRFEFACGRDQAFMEKATVDGGDRVCDCNY